MVVVWGFGDGEIFVVFIVLDYITQLELYWSHYFYNQKNKIKNDNNKGTKEAFTVWSIIIGNLFMNEGAWRGSPLPHGKAWITQGANTH